MSEGDSQLSNPFSTGGGGFLFEARVQASFVVLMLAGGFIPYLPRWPINKIKLQAKSGDYNTDDMVVFLKGNDNNQNCKMLAQIKHSITISETNKVFREVIQSAWTDYNNNGLFKKNKDVIALITGPLSATDINDVRTLLEWSRHMENSKEFFTNVEKAKFSSNNKRKKLKAFKAQLQNANGGNPVTEEELFDFLKHFHLLGYDLDIKSSITVSLLHSLIGQYSQDNISALWGQIIEEVLSFNQNAGTITLENLPADLCNHFKKKIYETIPEEYLPSKTESKIIDWNQHKCASDLAMANLIGSWDENNESDLGIIKEVVIGDLDE